MSDGFERESERAGGDRSSPSMMRLIGQMLMLPFTVFVYGMEVFVKTIHSVQKIADDGLDLTAGSVAPSPEDTQPAGKELMSETGPKANAQASRGAGNQEHRVVAVEVPTRSEGDRPASNEIESREKLKEATMDKDLRDDMLKLVRYKVLFVKREYEHAFPEQEDLVSENMDGAAFTAWKVAEFIQKIARVPYETKVPHRWGKNYPGAEHREGKAQEWLKGLPDDDKKYLRVFYEVLDRYPREKFKYEERQIEVLEEIRDKLPRDDGKKVS
ncbi:MAG: hypothetical protein AABN95_03720 [Acidobacteriota bacterium]